RNPRAHRAPPYSGGVVAFGPLVRGAAVRRRSERRVSERSGLTGRFASQTNIAGGEGRLREDAVGHCERIPNAHAGRHATTTPLGPWGSGRRWRVSIATCSRR